MSLAHLSNKYTAPDDVPTANTLAEAAAAAAVMTVLEPSTALEKVCDCTNCKQRGTHANASGF